MAEKHPEDSVTLRLTKDQAQAIHRLVQNPDFKALIALIAETLSKQDEDNRQLEGAHIYRGQGYAIALAEIVGIEAVAKQVLGIK